MFLLRFLLVTIFPLLLTPNTSDASAAVAAKAADLSLDSNSARALWKAARLRKKKPSGHRASRSKSPHRNTSSPKSTHSKRSSSPSSSDSDGTAPKPASATRTFQANLAGDSYTVEMDRGGALRILDPKNQQVAYHPQGIISVNFNTPELQRAQAILAEHVRKQFAPPAPPKRTAKPASTGAAGGSGAITSAAPPVSKAEPPPAPTPRPRGADSAAAGAPTTRGAVRAADDDDTLPALITPAEAKQQLSAARRQAVRDAYTQLIKAQKEAANTAETRKSVRTLIDRVKENPQHYPEMDATEQKALFFAAEQLQLQGNPKDVFELLQSKGVSLNELRTYKKTRARTLLKIAFRAGKYYEVADAIGRHQGFTKLFEGSNIAMLSLPGDFRMGSRYSVPKNLDTELQRLLNLKKGGHKVPTEDINLALEVLALSYNSAFFISSPQVNKRIRTLLKVFSSGENSAVDQFLANPAIPARSKVRLATQLQDFDVGSVAQQRKALAHVSSLRNRSQTLVERQELREGIVSLAKLGKEQDLKVWDLAYDAQYTAFLDKLEYPSLSKKLPLAKGTKDHALERLLAYKATVGGAGAEGKGGALSPKAKALQGILLAERALDAGQHQNAFKHARGVVLEASEELLPAARNRTYELQSQALNHILEVRSGQAQSEEFQRYLTQFQEVVRTAKRTQTDIAWETQVSLSRHQARQAMSQKKGNDAVLHLWEATRSNSLTGGRETLKIQSLVDTLSQNIDRLEIDETHRRYYQGLVQLYLTKAAEPPPLTNIPEAYHADMIYQFASRELMTNTSPRGKRTFLRKLEEIKKKKNPHPTLVRLMRTQSLDPDLTKRPARVFKELENLVPPRDYALPIRETAWDLYLIQGVTQPRGSIPYDQLIELEDALSVAVQGSMVKGKKLGSPAFENHAAMLQSHLSKSVINRTDFTPATLRKASVAQLEALLSALHYTINTLELRMDPRALEMDELGQLVMQTAQYRGARAQVLEVLAEHGLQDKKLGEVSLHPGVDPHRTLSDLYSEDMGYYIKFSPKPQ